MWRISTKITYMFRLTTTILIITAFLFLNHVSAQNKPDNALLWRITGNGLKEPSYLYGTIHITDKRVFQLGDSVHAAIANTSGLAAEVEMLSLGNEMMTSFINTYEDEGLTATEQSKEVLLKNLLEKDAWKYYKPKLEKLLKIKGDKITVSHLKTYKTNLKNDILKKGEMPTFLDAWLLSFARKNGKWIGGVEDPEDQLQENTTVQNLEEQISNLLYEEKHLEVQMDWLIRQYLGNRLDSIEQMYYRDGGEMDPVMIRRNKKMAYRMDSLSAVRSTFFAVGAAHLPGDEGVVNLLRDKGFTLTPVFSTKRIMPEDLPEISQENYWKTLAYEDSVYLVKMPGEAQRITNGAGMMMDMSMYFDMAAMQMYMSLQTPIQGEEKGEAIQRIISGLDKDKSGQKKILHKKETVIKGMPAAEFLVSFAGGIMRGQVIELDAKVVVLNAVMAFKEEDLRNSDADFFFESFAYDPQQLEKKGTDSYWMNLADENLGFSTAIVSLAKKEPRKTVDEDRTEYSWIGLDAKNQIVYGASVLIYNPGYYQSLSDTALFLAMKDNLSTMFKPARLLDSSFTTMNGYPAFSGTVAGKTEGQEMRVKYKLVLRGGIFYYLFTTYEPRDQNDIMASHYLNTFKLLPYKNAVTTLVKPGNAGFAFNTSGIIKDRTADFADQPDGNTRVAQSYELYDSLTGYTVNIDKTIIPDWYWVQSDSAFLANRSDIFISWNDSLINYTVSDKGNTKEASFIAVKKGTQILKKVKLVLNGNELYEIYGFISAKDTLDKRLDYLNGFKLTGPLKPVDRSRSNIAGLQKELATADAAAVKAIMSWAKTIDFIPADLPVLKQMALHPYADIDSLHSGMNSYLLQRISALDTTNTMVDVINAGYEGLDKNDKTLRHHLLNHLSRIKTEAAYTVLKNLLLSPSTTLDEDDYLYLNLYDSLALTATLYPDLLQIIKRPNFWPFIVRPLNDVLDNKVAEPAMILPYQDDIITIAEEVLEQDKEELNTYSYTYTRLLALLAYLDNERSSKLAEKFLQLENPELKFAAVKVLLTHNKPVAAKEIELLAKDDYYRLPLYEFLIARKKEALLSKAYLNRKELAKSKVHQLATDDGEITPEKITFLEERKVKYKGEEKKFLFFIVVFADEDEEGNATTTDYLAVAGPYSVKGKELVSKHEASGIIWFEEYKKNNLNSLFNQYLIQLEKYDEQE